MKKGRNRGPRGRPDEAHARLLASWESGYRTGSWVQPAELGETHWMLRRHDEARRWFELALAEYPDECCTSIWFGACLARAGRLEEAEEALRRGIRATEGPVDEAMHWLGLVLRAQGRYAEAIEQFDRAIAIDPDYEVAHRARRDVVMALERFPDL
jgi:tetratricopeptide (TPR) repeat protein